MTPAGELGGQQGLVEEIVGGGVGDGAGLRWVNFAVLGEEAAHGLEQTLLARAAEMNQFLADDGRRPSEPVA